MIDSKIDDDKLAIGINQLDQKHLNGLPKGSVISVLGPSSMPVSQFLAQLTHTRRTRYLTTEKPKSVVKNEAKSTSSQYVSEREVPDELSVHEAFDSNEPTDAFLRNVVSEIGEEQNIIIDSFTDVGVEIDDDDSYYSVLRDIYKATERFNGLTFLYFPVESYSDLNKREKEVLNVSDGVFLFEKSVIGQDIKTEMNIHKLRDIGELDRRVFRLRTEGKISIDSGEEIR